MAVADEQEFQGRIQQIEGLIHAIEGTVDPAARARSEQLVQLLLELHGAGMARMLAVVAESGDAADAVIGGFLRDDLVNSLLLLHDLHPLDLQTRVENALAKLRTSLRSQGGSLELLSMANGMIRLKLDESGGHGCGSGGGSSREMVEQAIYAAAPDLVSLDIEEQPQPEPGGFVSLTDLLDSSDGASGWRSRIAAGPGLASGRGVR